jgi:hypothetical protein
MGIPGGGGPSADDGDTLFPIIASGRDMYLARVAQALTTSSRKMRKKESTTGLILLRRMMIVSDLQLSCPSL